MVNWKEQIIVVTAAAATELHQGAVLSPILFLFNIDQLARKLPTTNVNSLNADDVSVLSTEDTKIY